MKNYQIKNNFFKRKPIYKLLKLFFKRVYYKHFLKDYENRNELFSLQILNLSIYIYITKEFFDWKKKQKHVFNLSNIFQKISFKKIKNSIYLAIWYLQKEKILNLKNLDKINYQNDLQNPQLDDNFFFEYHDGIQRQMLLQTLKILTQIIDIEKQFLQYDKSQVIQLVGKVEDLREILYQIYGPSTQFIIFSFFVNLKN